MPLYLNKDYRNRVYAGGLDSYEVKLKETDLQISSKGDFSVHAFNVLFRIRNEIERYISDNTGFLNSLEPVKPEKNMPPVVREMALASVMASVGPMAAVAGAIAGEVGHSLLKFSNEVIVENGGDVYIKTGRTAKIAVFAGESPLSMRVGIQFDPSDGELSLCTSSGTVGHSLSAGNADAAVCVSKNSALADAAATFLANMVIDSDDIEKALDACCKINGIDGCLVICKDVMGAAGDLHLCRIE